MQRFGFWDVWFEGDAKEVVDVVKKVGSDDSRFGQLIEDLKQKLSTIDAWFVGFTHREGN